MKDPLDKVEIAAKTRSGYAYGVAPFLRSAHVRDNDFIMRTRLAARASWLMSRVEDTYYNDRFLAIDPHEQIQKC